MSLSVMLFQDNASLTSASDKVSVPALHLKDKLGLGLASVFHAAVWSRALRCCWGRSGRVTWTGRGSGPAVASSVAPGRNLSRRVRPA